MCISENFIRKFNLDQNQIDVLKQSSSIHYELQQQKFSLENELLQGEVSRIEDINGKLLSDKDFDYNNSRLVIYQFTNGIINSPRPDIPAISYFGHNEYWDNGFIVKVTDINIEEIWDQGIPISIQVIKE